MKLERLSTKKLLNWLDNNLLTILAGFLLLFIPLYPKKPLFDALPGYNVRIRLEDVLILLTVIYFATQVLRKKIKLKQTPLSKPIFIYLIIGFLSTLSAIFITKTVYPEYLQIAKIYLHWFRRVEYFSLFFIFYFALKRKAQIKKFLLVLGVAVSAVSIYGFGQKYLYWPAYSTMNREFSKGVPVYLTQHARVMSTFGGHFDLAAYLMLTLIPLIIIGLLHKKKLIRRLSLSLAFIEYFLLVLSASRTSWIAYLVGIIVAFCLLIFKKGKTWVLIRAVSVLAISIFMMIAVGELSERFAHVFKLEGVRDLITRPFKTHPPSTYLPIDDQLGLVATKTDTPPSTTKPGRKPADVYDTILEDLKAGLATGSAEDASAAAAIGTYSEKALKYGLSAGIRLDVLWPNAIKGFLKNPFLGSGYSTLAKTEVWEFTFAESTDNDYLRLLGETGLLGFTSYLAVFVISLLIFWKTFQATQDPFYYGLFVSAMAITAGLLVNALYIDVFESSKVAYTYWSLMGLFLALAAKIKTKKTKS